MRRLAPLLSLTTIAIVTLVAAIWWYALLPPYGREDVTFPPTSIKGEMMNGRYTVRWEAASQETVPNATFTVTLKRKRVTELAAKVVTTVQTTVPEYTFESLDTGTYTLYVSSHLPGKRPSPRVSVGFVVE